MAKLKSYHVLCPLIDQNSFLGISADKDKENVIITLGRNVVNTYRLSDQKQITGWTSKDHITAVVVYDEQYESYVGVFNNNVIKMWKHNTENIEKLKKYKFPLTILKVLSRYKKSSLIVLTNGNCVSLPYGIDNRKSLDGTALLSPTDIIVEAQYYSINNVEYICYIIKNENNQYELATCPIRKEIGDLQRAKFCKFSISNDKDSEAHVVGKLICCRSINCVYILWSDSKLTSYDLVKRKWTTIGNVPWLSTATGTSLAWMGDRHLILFGSHTNGEGAVIVAYNVSLGIGSYKYPMKIYVNNAKVYCFSGRILLESGNHIGMMQYTVQPNRNLSTLLGSHEITADSKTEMMDWGLGDITVSVSDDVKQLLNLGITERAICAKVIPPLLEKTNIEDLQKALRQFVDIPENIIVMLLEYIAVKIVVEEPKTDRDYVTAFRLKKNKQKLLLLNTILEIPFSDALMIPLLREGVSISNVVLIMNFISYSLVSLDGKFGVDNESKLFDWCVLLLDAFYQQFVMSKWEAVTCALASLREVVGILLNQLDLVSSVLPLLDKVLRNKRLDDDTGDLTYTIELINI